jgi:hypothetical protein
MISMRHKTGLVVGALMTLAGGAAVHAHHSIAGVYDSARSVRLDGVVAAFRFVSPHPFVEVDVRAADGTVERWRLEMDNRFELTAVGMTADTLKAGDRVTVAGSAARDGGRGAYIRQLVRPSDGFTYEQVGSRPRVRLP